MSSRSKERVVTAIRKIFHKSSNNNNNNNNNNNHNNNHNNNNNSSSSSNDKSSDKVDGAEHSTSSKNNLNNNNNNNDVAAASTATGNAAATGAANDMAAAAGAGGGGTAGQPSPKNAIVRVAAEQPVCESPGKRRRQDHKVAPTTGRSLMMPPDASIRSRRLMKEYREMERLQTKDDAVFTVELVNDSLFEWHVRLHVIDPDSPLARDMVEMSVPAILLHLSFPDNFPFAPPFMRVVEPRIEKGYVMEGGAICMELLTPRGWASAYTVEAVIMQFAASVVKGQGRIARKPKSTKEFSRRQAEESFRSLVKTHEKYGWVTPALADG
ncbi:ubiquitin-conjugating enzyme E2Q-like protein CG4502 [Drosophila novamexicana]|uniref:ubiquitin-conjugating enzyme E2Q-like protein CG4502 n=1 Tax=Drosophila novamexicana TaxID=47314 RepID=UPI0011E601E9|nr:ubiquitin-conjugating enzyme E2Q-like protein CG4502 [Drosophila novamexicana]XP_030556787.1 ubiquitin-conjugating enzyme E2Q-like protein CG4502 [Drosophila novamexicana]